MPDTDTNNATLKISSLWSLVGDVVMNAITKVYPNIVDNDIKGVVAPTTIVLAMGGLTGTPTAVTAFLAASTGLLSTVYSWASRELDGYVDSEVLETFAGGGKKTAGVLPVWAAAGATSIALQGLHVYILASDAMISSERGVGIDNGSTGAMQSDS